MEWISVKDRFPIGYQVLIWVISDGIYLGYFDVDMDHWESGLYGGGKIFKEEDVTHWTALPNPPITKDPA